MLGLRGWQTIREHQERAGLVLDIRGSALAPDKALVEVSGTVRVDGRVQPFSRRNVYHYFAPEEVVRILRTIGWRSCHLARPDALGEPLAAADGESQVYLVATG